MNNLSSSTQRSYVLMAIACVIANAVPAASLQLELDPAASSVTFDVRVNVGFHSFVGTVDTWTLDLAMPAEGEIPERAIFTAQVTALKTGKNARDEKMRAWLEETTHPTLRYKMTAIRKTDAGLEADGDLTVHGKTLPLTIPIVIDRRDAVLTVRGEAKIDYRDFDLEVIRLAGLITVKPEVQVKFVAAGTLK